MEPKSFASQCRSVESPSHSIAFYRRLTQSHVDVLAVLSRLVLDSVYCVTHSDFCRSHKRDPMPYANVQIIKGATRNQRAYQRVLNLTQQKSERLS